MKSKSHSIFKFCPICGAKLAKKKHDHLVRLVCTKCAFVYYQNSKPTVSALIRNKKGELLLVKRAVPPNKGSWDTPGGFLEDGEDPIPGLRREMKEELNVKLKNIKYFGIYTDFYFERYKIYALNIIYICEISSGNIKPQDDVSEFQWFKKRNIPYKKFAFRWISKALREYSK
ncbi:MAG: NUDIX domain-containing protein [Candidatus Kerfeldbacteria bacterium]|jgi:ADP-ribose pyrophosphatase YjhB (NUDIX family)